MRDRRCYLSDRLIEVLYRLLFATVVVHGLRFLKLLP
jgi:hypothetical protein